MDKHLLAENPMRPHEGGVCINRTVMPIAMFEVIEGHVANKEYHKHYTYKNGDGELEEYTLEVFHYFATDEDHLLPKNVYKYMEDAWHWYKAYMKWEDDNLDQDEYAQLN